jgi:peptide/nickel transport system substrate-binding protein
MTSHARLTLLACGGLACSQPSPEPAATAARQALVIGIDADVTSLNQHFATSALDAFVTDPLSWNLCYSELVDGALVHRPGLASTWAFSADGLLLELRLRDDSRWADGQPVTARDVAFTFGLLADPDLGSSLAGVLDGLRSQDPVELGEGTVGFHLAPAGDPEAVLGELCGVVILPEHLLASVPPADLREHPFNRAPVLNGAWRLASWEPDAWIRLEAAPAGTLPPELIPRLDDLVFRVVPEYGARLMALEAGEIDLMADLRVADAEVLARTHPELRLHRRGPRNLVYVGWNHWVPGSDRSQPHPLFADPALRRAMAQAVDIDRIIDDLFTGANPGERYAQAAVGTITPALTQASPVDLRPIPHDPVAARDALEALGWIDSDADGVLDRGGQPLSFELLTRATTKPRAQAAVYLQADLAAVGVRLDIVSLERGAYYERLFDGDFDAVLGGFATSLYVDPGPLWHSGPDARLNFIGYANPAVDAAIDRGQAAPVAERPEIWQELQRLIYEDQPYLFLYWADEIVAVDGRFEDTRIDLGAPWRDLHRWRVSEQVLPLDGQ